LHNHEVIISLRRRRGHQPRISDFVSSLCYIPYLPMYACALAHYRTYARRNRRMLLLRGAFGTVLVNYCVHAQACKHTFTPDTCTHACTMYSAAYALVVSDMYNALCNRFRLSILCMCLHVCVVARVYICVGFLHFMHCSLFCCRLCRTGRNMVWDFCFMSASLPTQLEWVHCLWEDETTRERTGHPLNPKRGSINAISLW